MVPSVSLSKCSALLSPHLSEIFFIFGKVNGNIYFYSIIFKDLHTINNHLFLRGSVNEYKRCRLLLQAGLQILREVLPFHL